MALTPVQPWQLTHAPSKTFLPRISDVSPPCLGEGGAGGAIVPGSEDVNYVTNSSGAEESRISAKDVVKLRSATLLMQDCMPDAATKKWIAVRRSFLPPDET